MDIFTACREDNVAHVVSGIDANIDIKLVDPNGNTPIHIAIEAGAINVVAVLVERGGYDINAGEYIGWSCLQHAIRHNRPKIIDYLLIHRANTGARDMNNDTPLHYASYYDSATEIVKQLVTAGVDVNATNNYGKTPLHVYYIDCVSRGGIATFSEKITILLAAGANINAQVTGSGDTILHYAVRDNKIDRARFLLENGASMEIQNWKGKTALDVATHTHMTTLLREYALLSNIKNAARGK